MCCVRQLSAGGKYLFRLLNPLRRKYECFRLFTFCVEINSPLPQIIKYYSDTATIFSFEEVSSRFILLMYDTVIAFMYVILRKASISTCK